MTNELCSFIVLAGVQIVTLNVRIRNVFERELFDHKNNSDVYAHF